MTLLPCVSNRPYTAYFPSIQPPAPSVKQSKRNIDKIQQVQKKTLPCQKNRKKNSNIHFPSPIKLSSLKDLLSTYKIKEFIESGSCAKVFRITDQNNKSYAAKIYNSRFENVHQEARILNILKGFAHVPQFYEVVGHQERLVIVMELLQESDLYLMRALSFNEIITIFKQSLEFLVECKKKGIIYFDLKPENMGYDKTQKRLKIFDMELAKFSTELSSSEPRGSFGFIAPELLFGCPYNESLDIWSLACTMYDLYTGEYLIPGLKGNSDNAIEIKGGVVYAMIARCGMFPKSFLNAASRDVSSYFTRDKEGEYSPKDKMSLPLWQLAMRNYAHTFGEADRVEKLIALLKRMFVYDPKDRISPEEALKDPLFENDVHVKIVIQEKLSGDKINISYADTERSFNERLLTIKLSDDLANLSCVHIIKKEEYSIEYDYNGKNFEQVSSLKNNDIVTLP